MREALSGVPVLYWVAFVLLALAIWSDDYIGIVIAGACMLVGTLQVIRDRPPSVDED